MWLRLAVGLLEGTATSLVFNPPTAASLMAEKRIALIHRRKCWAAAARRSPCEREAEMTQRKAGSGTEQRTGERIKDGRVDELHGRQVYTDRQVADESTTALARSRRPDETHEPDPGPSIRIACACAQRPVGGKIEVRRR